jgi:hypothetical protein
MADEVDYEDLTGMQLDDEALDALVKAGGECIFNWTTKDGYPVGVVVAFVYKDGKFWTTCAERRKRVPALRARPQSAIVINAAGKTASFKGDSIVHALSQADANPGDAYAQSFRKFLDSPHRVIIETDARLVVAFDTAKFATFTAEAMAAGRGAD